jgi:VIT1/CCC1 family predicted Fe2+/Mn2+ transporter
MRNFFKHALDPADRLGEVLFGLIMALGFTGAVRLGHEEADNRALFIGILGCNVAWGIVDGVMYVIGELFERGRRFRLARRVIDAPTEAAAFGHVDKEFGSRALLDLATPEERDRFHKWVVELVRRWEPVPARIRRADLLGGLAVALLIVLCTAPIVAPFLLVSDPNHAVRAAHGIGLVELFLLGLWWGRTVGVSPWRISLGLTLVGLALVGVCIALGG